jgi:3-deoxy-D-manno-octulosonic-acid transferase
MLFLYNLLIRIFGAAVFISSFFKAKARHWISGRWNWRANLRLKLKKNEQRIWIHCASLGEFEQGRNLIEELKTRYPSYKILLTFFSPSGYEIRKDYQYADYVFYLPLDTEANARDFIQLIDPSLAIFIKYEFWYHYLSTLKQKNIPTIIVSAAFREEQPFFHNDFYNKWVGDFFREMLQCFTMIFVQDQGSKALLGSIGVRNNVIVAGDTRYDRVLTILANRTPLSLIEAFLQGAPALIAGSTWQNDERILWESFASLPKDWKLIIAPHEIEKDRIYEIQTLFNDSILYSELLHRDDSRNKRVLIIDNIGMLSSLYAYGKIAFVGGGYQKGGIHNILEPAVFGLPIVFGPVYQKFVEANILVHKKLCFPVDTIREAQVVLAKLSTDEANYQLIHNALFAFMQEQAGATDKILAYVLKLLYT